VLSWAKRWQRTFVRGYLQPWDLFFAWDGSVGQIHDEFHVRHVFIQPARQQQHLIHGLSARVEGADALKVVLFHVHSALDDLIPACQSVQTLASRALLQISELLDCGCNQHNGQPCKSTHQQCAMAEDVMHRPRSTSCMACDDRVHAHVPVNSVSECLTPPCGWDLCGCAYGRDSTTMPCCTPKSKGVLGNLAKRPVANGWVGIPRWQLPNLWSECLQ